MISILSLSKQWATVSHNFGFIRSHVDVAFWISLSLSEQQREFNQYSSSLEMIYVTDNRCLFYLVASVKLIKVLSQNKCFFCNLRTVLMMPQDVSIKMENVSFSSEMCESTFEIEKDVAMWMVMDINWSPRFTLMNVSISNWKLSVSYDSG